MAETARVLDERFGSAGLEAFAEVFRRLGDEDAHALTKMLGLGTTIRDAVDAWLVIGNLMGASMTVTWLSPSHAETRHPYCPQYEAFKKHGRLYCDSVCIPYVQSVAEGIAPGIRLEVTTPADMDHTCSKALIATESDSS